MNPLIKKEIRILLPGFSLGVATALASLFVTNGIYGFNGVAIFITFIACPALAVFMALNSFGAEVSAGTFTMLLAQPVSRRQIWRTKTSLLAAALISGGLVWCAILFLNFGLHKLNINFGSWQSLFTTVWLFLLAIYSGSLWTVLLLRQVAAAFWFTLLAPCVIVVSIIGLVGDDHDTARNWLTVAALLIYSGAGFMYARFLFLRAQDVQWTGGTISLPQFRSKSNSSTGTAGKRFWRPKAALFRKELQLHQSQFIMAGVLLLFHLIVLAVRKLCYFHPNSSTLAVLETFWGLWLVLPVLIGAAAVSEERKLGTLGAQLCLPVKHRTQFLVKFLVVLILSVFFGAIIPILLEQSRILPAVHLPFAPHLKFPPGNGSSLLVIYNSFANDLVWPLPKLIFAALVAGIGVISFYASSLARNTLQALAPAILGILVFVTLMASAYRPDLLFHYPLWRGFLIYLIGLPIFVITLIVISFWNFQRLIINWNVWWRNLLGFAAAIAIAIIATTALYHRAWEKLAPFEPPHGVARLSLSNPPVLSTRLDNLNLRLPDGRVWTSYLPNSHSPEFLDRILGNIRMLIAGNGHFYSGSNWLAVNHNPSGQETGIKTDGTLWISQVPDRTARSKNRGPIPSWLIETNFNLEQFGTESNWSSVAPIGLMDLLLVKTDGTLWRLGPMNPKYTLDKWPGYQSFTPARVGNESNWAAVFHTGYELCLRKNDAEGSIWTRSYDNNKSTQPVITLWKDFSIERESISDYSKYQSVIRYWGAPGYLLGVQTNGNFALLAGQKFRSDSRYYEWCQVNRPFGHDTSWLAVAGRGEKVVTLRKDGTLWQWNFHHDYSHGWDPAWDEQQMLAVTPSRLGTHSDWVAITDADGGILSLAADGSLWYWPLEDASYFTWVDPEFFGDSSDNNYFVPLFDISRKPQRLANVFDAAN